ncbi:MAG: hypothetical protein ABI632_03200 [Pseudolysinimonas sp.]
MPFAAPAIVALALAVSGVLSATPPPSPTPAPDALNYVGTATYTTAYGDGSHVVTQTVNAAVTVRCDDGVCVLIGIDLPGYTAPFTFTDGVLSVSKPATGDVCAGDYLGASTFDATATATAFSATFDIVPSGKRDCGGGNTSEFGSLHSVYTMTLHDGDPCLLDTTTCPTPTPSPSADAAGGAGLIGHRGIDDPSVLSTLPTAADAITAPNLLWAAVGTVVLVLLIAFPTQLFNSAADRANAAARAWWRRRRGASKPSSARRVSFAGWPLAAGGVLLAGVISAFVDPGFGLDAAGWRALLSILVSFAIEVGVGWIAVILLVRRTHPDATPKFEFQPLSLLVVALAVVVSRLSGFEPGIVFGLVAGVAFGGLLATADRARVALIGIGWAFAIGVVAWLGYSLIPADTEGVGLFARETLSSASIAGMAALPIALLPARGLTGFAVWSWRRPVWIAAYAVGVFAFLLVLLPLPASWAAVHASIWTWAGLYLLYAIAAIGVWLVVTRPWKSEQPAPR